MTKINTINDLEVLRKRLLKDRKKFRATIVMCGGTGARHHAPKTLSMQLKTNWQNRVWKRASVCVPQDATASASKAP